jgi:hypothetical protein
MGYGSEIFGLLKQLSIDKELNNLESVCDFGSQELHFAEKDIYSNSSAEIIRQIIFAMGGQTTVSGNGWRILKKFRSN